MTTPLTPETSRRIEEPLPQEVTNRIGDLAEYVCNSTRLTVVSLFDLVVAALETQARELLKPELAQSQGEGKAKSAAQNTAAAVLTYLEDCSAAERWPSQDAVERIFADNFAPILNSRTALESQLSALKAELEATQSLLKAMTETKDQYFHEKNKLRSELEQARAERVIPFIDKLLATCADFSCWVICGFVNPDEVKGKRQPHDQFDHEFVDPSGGGITGDDFAGHIYLPIAGKYLKIWFNS